MSLDVSTTTIGEADGIVTVCISEMSRSNSKQRDVQVNIETVDGTANGNKYLHDYYRNNSL